MDFTTAATFTGDRAWDALPIAEIEGATVRLHWTDRPYVWHVNDGAEVFVVLDGVVEMRFRRDGVEVVQPMRAGDICHAACFVLRQQVVARVGAEYFVMRHHAEAFPGAEQLEEFLFFVRVDGHFVFHKSMFN